MKPLRYTLIALAAACGFANAQTAYTTPVGYVTKSLPPNQFTLVGLTLHESVKSAGVITGESATSVTVAGVDWVALLGTPGTDTYVLELPDGTVQEITAWDNLGVLTTPDDITANVVPNTTTYKLRKAATIASVFGAANEKVGLGEDTDGSLTGTDFVLVPNASGAFDTIYYFDDGAGTTGWFDTLGNPADAMPLVYPDAMFIQRAASATTLSMVVTGEVKTVATAGMLAAAGYSYLNGVAPTGVTLADSGLKDYLAIDSTGDLSTADLVLIQQPDGAYLTCYYFNDGAGTEGWFDDLGNPADTQVIDGGFLVLNRTTAKAYKVSVPGSYATL